MGQEIDERASQENHKNSQRMLDREGKKEQTYTIKVKNRVGLERERERERREIEVPTLFIKFST
jgi:hypothetical protein